MLYDVTDKYYLSNVLMERAFCEIGEELTGSQRVTFTIDLPNLKL